MKLLGLNEPQKKAVTHGDGPLVVLAAAGSGKTRALTHRVAYLIKEHGILPSRLFVTTFTNKAAEEMCVRLESMIGLDKVERLKIGTSHSLFRKILFDLLKEIYPSRDYPSLVMSGGRYMTMLSILKQNKIQGIGPKEALRRVSLWKSSAMRVEDVQKAFGAALPAVKAYDLYEKALRENNRYEFDDMLFRTYWLLQHKRAVGFLEKLRKRTDHILVDESHDINRVQFLLFNLLAEGKNNITIVLDDYQSIYRFRGACPEVIFQFIDEKKPSIIKLEQNYRSTKQIVDLGNKLIKSNSKQLWKTLFTENDQGDAPEVLVSTDADDEADKVFEHIQDLIVNKGYALNDIVILYRTHAQSRALVDIFVRNVVPHKVFAKHGFYDRPEVKDIIAYLRIVMDPFAAGIEDFRRIINKPTRYLGTKFLNEVEQLQINHNRSSFWEGFRYLDDLGHLHGSQRSSAKAFIDLIEKLHAWVIGSKGVNTSAVFHKIIAETGYDDWLKQAEAEDDDEPDDDRGLNLESLLAGAERFPRPENFLTFIDSIGEMFEDEDDFISLMSLHGSKGLEYPIVIIIGVSEGLLPHYRAEDLEEERRVAYVGVTRTMEQLVLSLIHGKYNRRNVTASRFITEMGIPIPQTLGGVHVGYVAPVSEQGSAEEKKAQPQGSVPVQMDFFGEKQ